MHPSALPCDIGRPVNQRESNEGVPTFTVYTNIVNQMLAITLPDTGWIRRDLPIAPRQPVADHSTDEWVVNESLTNAIRIVNRSDTLGRNASPRGAPAREGIAMHATGDNRAARGVSGQPPRHPPVEDRQEAPSGHGDAGRGTARGGYHPAGPSLPDEATIPTIPLRRHPRA